MEIPRPSNFRYKRMIHSLIRPTGTFSQWEKGTTQEQPMNAPRTRDSWQALADGLQIRTQAFIEGKYVDAASGKSFDCISPIDGRSLGRVADRLAHVQ